MGQKSRTVCLLTWAQATLMILFGAVACSSVPSDESPAAVSNALHDLISQCTEVNGTPHAERAVRRVDLNGDLNDEFVVYAGWIDCENAWSIYGDREKVISVFTGDGHGGATATFSDLVYDAKIESAGNSIQLWLTMAAEACGRRKAQSFADETFCDRAIAWNAASARFEYAPVSTVRIIK